VVHVKTFILTFILVYLLISLPTILGINYVIDWVSEATFLQKFNGYVVNGLTENYLFKIVISAVAGGIVSLTLALKHNYSNKRS